MLLCRQSRRNLGRMPARWSQVQEMGQWGRGPVTATAVMGDKGSGPFKGSASRGRRGQEVEGRQA